MPAVSELQREKLNAKFGHAWVKRHHFDNKGKLPYRVQKGKAVKKHPDTSKAYPRLKKVHKPMHPHKPADPHQPTSPYKADWGPSGYPVGAKPDADCRMC